MLLLLLLLMMMLLQSVLFVHVQTRRDALRPFHPRPPSRAVEISCGFRLTVPPFLLSLLKH